MSGGTGHKAATAQQLTGSVTGRLKRKPSPSRKWQNYSVSHARMFMGFLIAKNTEIVSSLSAWPTGRALPKKSFKAWLKSQSTYQLQKSKKETHGEPPLKLQCPKNGKYYSFQEIQAFYGISRPTLDSWVLKEGIPTMKLGRVKRIQKDAFDEVLKSKRKVEEDV